MKKGPAKVGGVSDNGAAGVNVSGEEGAPKPDEVFFFVFFSDLLSAAAEPSS